MADPYREGRWGEYVNYECTECPRADLDKDSLLMFQAHDCPLDRCPGKPTVQTRTSPVIAPSGANYRVTEQRRKPTRKKTTRRKGEVDGK